MDDMVMQQQLSSSRRRRRRRKGQMKFGDSDFTLSSIDEFDEARWGEVYDACCTHTWEEMGHIVLGILGLCFFLYFFTFSLDLLTTSASVVSGCRGGTLFEASMNPVSAVMVSSIATSLIKSSSTTTSIIVALVSDGLVTVEDGIYLVMGANIGTTITNDIMALAQFRNVEEFERAFGAACLHDMFNILTVTVLLPLEVLTGYLKLVTELIVYGAETKKGEEWKGPVALWVKPLTNKLIIANKKAILAVAENKKTCEEFYPTTCVDGIPESYATCHQGFVGCDKSTGECPAWFRQGATFVDDKIAGGVTVVVALILCYICLVGWMVVAQFLLKGLTTRVVYKVANVNGYLGIAIGASLTMLLQSSSLTTSLYVPWAGIGVLRLEQVYPLTLGSNIGTTLTAILTALVASGLNPLQVALAHLFFNITGVLLWYPIPHLRMVPIYLARQLGKAARITRFFPLLYIISTFFLFPHLVLGISELFAQGNTAAGAVIVSILGVVVIGGIYWCFWLGGGHITARAIVNFKRRGRLNVAPTATDPSDDLDNEVDKDEESA